MMSLLVASIAFGGIPGHAQEQSEACLIGPDEAAAHKAILSHFRVYATRVSIVQNNKTAAPDGYAQDIAKAVLDFNRRNAHSCPDKDISGESVFEGSSSTRLSRIGFDTTKTHAFGEITMIGGPELGSSHYVVLHKSEAKWAVVKQEPYRIF